MSGEKMPEVIYATHAEDDDLKKEGFLDAVQRDPEGWFSSTKPEVYGVYRLIEVKTLEPRKPRKPRNV